METGKSAGGDRMSWVVHEDMKIEMTKGDTPSFAFQAFLPDGSEYEFEEGDSVVFAAKRNKADPEPALRIEADVKEKVIRFSEEDTKHLELGKYIWELSLNKSSGYRCTFIANKVLKLTVEVA
ncbi:MAG: hypothetical protein ACLTGZ_09685 [Clostridium sp.]